MTHCPFPFEIIGSFGSHFFHQPAAKAVVFQQFLSSFIAPPGRIAATAGVFLDMSIHADGCTT